MSFEVKEELGQSQSFDIDNVEVEKLSNLFQKLEKDSDPTDTSIVDASYYSTFLFCDPRSVNPIKKEDFLKFIPMMSREYSDMGFKSKKVKKLNINKLDSLYFQVQVDWEMLFERNGKTKKIDDIKATYILKKEDDWFKIIMQLDHQNLSDIVN